MISELQAVLQGIVEGVTEFLPISSTGHLIVTGHFLGLDSAEHKEVNDAFEIVIQFGAILAVLGFYRDMLRTQVQQLATDPRVRRLWLNLCIAFLPVASCGLLFHHWVEEHLMNPAVVATSLIIGGLVLLKIEAPTSNDAPDEDRVQRLADVYDMMPRHALAIGCAQLLALIPGVSRSGSSIIGGMLAGLDRQAATTFSFFLSIPVLGSATVYKFLKSYKLILSSGNLGAFAIGTTVSFVVAWLSIGWLLRYIASHSFRGFGFYRIAAGLVVYLSLT